MNLASLTIRNYTLQSRIKTNKIASNTILQVSYISVTEGEIYEQTD